MKRLNENPIPCNTLDRYQVRGVFRGEDSTKSQRTIWRGGENLISLLEEILGGEHNYQMRETIQLLNSQLELFAGDHVDTIREPKLLGHSNTC